MLYKNYIPLYFICQHFETIFTEKVRQTSYVFVFNDNNPKCTSCKLLNVNQQIKNGLLFKATNACGIFLQMAKNTDNENNLQRSLFTGHSFKLKFISQQLSIRLCMVNRPHLINSAVQHLKNKHLQTPLTNGFLQAE